MTVTTSKPYLTATSAYLYMQSAQVAYNERKRTLRKHIRQRAYCDAYPDASRGDSADAYNKWLTERREIAEAREVLARLSMRNIPEPGIRVSLQAWCKLSEAARYYNLKWAGQYRDVARRMLWLRQCPLCGNHMANRNGHDIDVCAECYAEGAVLSVATNTWYRNAAARADAEQPTCVWVVDREATHRIEMPKRHIETGVVTPVMTPDGAAVTIDGERVYAAQNLQRSYHDRDWEVPQYDDAPIRVGTELEVNREAGADKNNDIARILMATKHQVKVERDGSVTGFEIITGHGKPSSIREVISPIFTGELLSNYAVSVGTGAHVHATAPRTDMSYAEIQRLKSLHEPLVPLYEKVAGRAYRSYAVRGAGATRYASLAVRESTWEWRLFKMQMSLPKLMRNMGFAWAATQYYQQSWDTESSLDGFLTFVGDLPREETIELRAALAFYGYKVPCDMKAYRKMYRDMGLRTTIG